jgi:hypothetical protein
MIETPSGAAESGGSPSEEPVGLTDPRVRLRHSSGIHGQASADMFRSFEVAGASGASFLKGPWQGWLRRRSQSRLS